MCYAGAQHLSPKQHLTLWTWQVLAKGRAVCPRRDSKGPRSTPSLLMIGLCETPTVESLYLRRQFTLYCTLLCHKTITLLFTQASAMSLTQELPEPLAHPEGSNGMYAKRQRPGQVFLRLLWLAYDCYRSSAPCLSFKLLQLLLPLPPLDYRHRHDYLLHKNHICCTHYLCCKHPCYWIKARNSKQARWVLNKKGRFAKSFTRFQGWQKRQKDAS